MPNTPKAKRELTGRHVLFMLLAFFGVMLSVNVFFTVMAVKSFSGEDVPRSYRQGIEYNKTIERRAAQNALGWSAHINSAKDKIIIEIRDKEKQPIADLSVSGQLRHPATLSNDQTLEFIQQPNGSYHADIFGLQGKWELEGTARSETSEFQFEYELWLQ